MIGSFSGNITKVLINGKQVSPSGLRTVDEEAGRKLVIEVHFSVIPVGDVKWNDHWTVGAVVQLGDQKAWGHTTIMGGGQKTGKVVITGLRAPSKRQEIKWRLLAIDAVSPTAPGGR